MLTRRTLLVSSAVAATGLWMRAASAQSPTPRITLPIPQLIDARTNGGNISLTVGAGTHTFLPGKPVKSFGYSAPFLGPAIRGRRGDGKLNSGL